MEEMEEIKVGIIYLLWEEIVLKVLSLILKLRRTQTLQDNFTTSVSLSESIHRLKCVFESRKRIGGIRYLTKNFD